MSTGRKKFLVVVPADKVLEPDKKTIEEYTDPCWKQFCQFNVSKFKANDPRPLTDNELALFRESCEYGHNWYSMIVIKTAHDGYEGVIETDYSIDANGIVRNDRTGRMIKSAMESGILTFTHKGQQYRVSTRNLGARIDRRKPDEFPMEPGYNAATKAHAQVYAVSRSNTLFA